MVWQSLAWPSTVVHRQVVTAQAIEEHGIAAGKTDQGAVFAYEYKLLLTPAWEIKSANITSLLDERTIALHHDAGTWRDAAGKTLHEFDGIPYIDLSFSPFTNTLPIKRAPFVDDEELTIDTLYFDENSFSLTKVQQRYRRLGPKKYRYQDVETPDFTANIDVDDDGLVTDYQHLFARMR